MFPEDNSHPASPTSELAVSSYHFRSAMAYDEIHAYEQLHEALLAAFVPRQLLQNYISTLRKSVSEREAELRSYGADELAALNDPLEEKIESIYDLIRRYTLIMDSYQRRKDPISAPSFKASGQRREASLAFIPSNCHLHELRVHNGENASERGAYYNVVTFGAAAAHSMDFKRGGLARMKKEMEALESRLVYKYVLFRSNLKSRHTNNMQLTQDSTGRQTDTKTRRPTFELWTRSRSSLESGWISRSHRSCRRC